MKTLLLIFLSLVSVNSFAEVDCKEKAINATIEAAFPKGIMDGFWIIQNSELVDVLGPILQYNVNLVVRFNQGDTNLAFAEEQYYVIAKGDESSCEIAFVKNRINEAR